MGWTNPWVLAGLIGGVALLGVFVLVEMRVSDPMFPLKLFRDLTFSSGNAASLLGSIARGGLQFMLIIWLQGIWLPLHGYDYADTPLWAGIYLLPLTVGFLLAGPIAGRLSDRYGARWFAAAGLLVMSLSFAGLLLIPTDFSYPVFAVLVFLQGAGGGLFAAPEHRARHVERAGPPARGRLRHAVDVHERRHGPVDRRLLLPDGGRAGQLAAADAPQWTDRAGRARPGGPDASPDCRRSARCSRRSSATTRSSNCSDRRSSATCRRPTWPR